MLSSAEVDFKKIPSNFFDTMIPKKRILAKLRNKKKKWHMRKSNLNAKYW